VVFAVGLIGLAVYSASGDAMRLVPATTAVWVLARFAFWIGYHRSPALRGAGAPSMMIGMLMLIWVVGNVAFEIGGMTAVIVFLTLFGGLEAVLFWKTRSVGEPSS